MLEVGFNKATAFQTFEKVTKHRISMMGIHRHSHALTEIGSKNGQRKEIESILHEQVNKSQIEPNLIGYLAET